MAGMLEEQRGGGVAGVSKGERRMRGEGMGQIVQGLVGCGEGLGFYLEGGGSSGGLWAEEGQDPGPVSAPSDYCGEDRLWGVGQELEDQVQVT